MAIWDIGFPVDFTENGDKTRNAIQKHINELSKVYGHLNELGSNTGSATTSIPANPLKIFVNPGADEIGFRTASYQGSNPPAPNAETGKTPLWELYGIGGDQWWNVLTYGTGDRLCQLAVQVLVPHVGRVFTRSQHDAEWSSWLEMQTGSGIPKGMISMWSGLISEIPAGWALCDGQDGRPNLLGKFIRGVPDTATDPGITGGADALTLGTEHLPAHTHEANPHTHTSDGGGGSHNHFVKDVNMTTIANGNGGLIQRVLFQQQGTSLPSGYSIKTNFSNGGGGALNETTITLQNAGGGQAFDNRPAFYELAYIIKL